VSAGAPLEVDVSRTEALLALDRRHLWHPFTAQSEWEEEPQLVIERGEGMFLIDTDGRRYIDGVSSLWVNVFGHRVPEIDAAVRGQLDRLAHSTMLGLSNVPAIETASRLVAHLPGPLDRVFLSDDGSTAVEVAVKMAFQFCRQNGRAERTRFLAFSDGYHGDTLGSVSMGGIGLFHGVFHPLLFEVVRAPYPYCYRCPLGESGDPAECGLRCAAETEALIEREGGTLAACVIEPRVQGAAGMVTAPTGFLRRVADACRRRGVLLVADEVATGICRTGPFLACEAEGVVPDFACLAKGLTGGYLPVAATATTDEIYRGFLGPRHWGRTFFHGHSYTGNPLGCAAAAATLDLVRDRALPAHVGRIDAVFERLLAPLRSHPLVGDARRAGVMTGLELVADRERRTPFAPERRVGHRVAVAARRHGAIVRPIGDVVILNPPPAIDEATLAALVSAVSSALDDVRGELRGGVSAAGPAARTAVVAAPSSPGLLPLRLAITGTDTGVGKTFVGAMIARRWRAAGLRVAVAKPVESGAADPPDGTSDAEVLAAAAADGRGLARITATRFPASLAPTAAAAAAGRSIDPAAVRRCVREALDAGEAVLVEGAGGLLVELAPGLTLRDLAREFDLPLLVVAADRLGCANHAALTVEAARGAGCRVCGVVLSAASGAPDASVGGNRALIERMAGVPVLFEVPWIEPGAGDPGIPV
jgi:adenosylmethionine-8-amino-7-oxononanoate aminotransferase